jgi:hypothetical protein
MNAPYGSYKRGVAGSKPAVPTPVTWTHAQVTVCFWVVLGDGSLAGVTQF